jgi:hypothetical protein
LGPSRPPACITLYPSMSQRIDLPMFAEEGSAFVLLES